MMLAAFTLIAAHTAPTPREFIADVYSGYANAGFSPLAQPALYFTPELADAIAKDSSGDEVGYLDGDPLCDCQDYERLSPKVLTLRQQSSTTAVAHVRVDLGGGQTRDLELRLIKTSVGWRISDVVGPDRTSLMGKLQRANAKR